jgi:hypothetical protein
LKNCLEQAPILKPIDYDKSLILTVDAGPKGGGGFLGQESRSLKAEKLFKGRTILEPR